VVSYSSAEVTCSELGTSQTQQSLSVVGTHANLRFDDFEQHTIEGLLEGIGLLFEELVTLLGTDSLCFVYGQVPKE